MNVRTRFGMAVLLAAAVAGAGCPRRAPPQVTDTERALFPRAADLAQAFDLRIAAPESNETFTIDRSWDGSFDVDYEYDGSDAVESNDALYVQGSLSIQPSLRDARMVQGAVKLGLGIGNRLNDLKTRAVPGFSFGEASELGVIVSGGVDVGNFMIVRDGRRVYTLILSGVCVTNAADWNGLMRPWLDRFAAYRDPAARTK